MEVARKNTLIDDDEYDEQASRGQAEEQIEFDLAKHMRECLPKVIENVEATYDKASFTITCEISCTNKDDEAAAVPKFDVKTSAKMSLRAVPIVRKARLVKNTKGAVQLSLF